MNSAQQAKVKRKTSSARRAGRRETANGAVKKTRRQQVASKEGALIEAARRLFLEQGFAGATVSGIAREAGVAEGTLYLYFNNKDALARAVLADFYGRLTDTAREGVEKARSTKARLEFLAGHHLRHVMAERRLFEIPVVMERESEAYKSSDIYRMNKEYVAVFDGVIREGIARGDIADERPLWMTRDFFFGSLEYAMRTIMLRGAADQADDAAKSLTKLILRKNGSASAGRGAGDPIKRIENAAARLEALVEKQSAVIERA